MFQTCCRSEASFKENFKEGSDRLMVLPLRYVNVSLTPQAYEVLKELKRRMGVKSYSDVILRLYEGSVPEYRHEELALLCKLLDKYWDDINKHLKRIIGDLK